MFRRSVRCFALLAFGILALAPAARSATFDLIYADRIEVSTYPSNVGFTLSGTDIGLVVNKGLTNIDAAEFFGTTLSATSSDPSVQAIPFINNPGPAITPIHPNEALGSVTSLNGVLTSRLLAGETLRNTTPLQVISLQVNYPSGFSGQVAFDVTMIMGANVAHYTIVGNFVLGSSFAISFPSAARVASMPLPTATRATTWGAIKRLYR